MSCLDEQTTLENRLDNLESVPNEVGFSFWNASDASYKTGSYFRTNSFTKTGGIGNTNWGRLYYTGVFVPSGITVDQALIYTLTDNTYTLKLAIYDDTGYGYPANLLNDFGSFNVPSGSGSRLITFDLSYTFDNPDLLYWWAIITPSSPGPANIAVNTSAANLTAFWRPRFPGAPAYDRAYSNTDTTFPTTAPSGLTFPPNSPPVFALRIV